MQLPGICYALVFAFLGAYLIRNWLIREGIDLMSQRIILLALLIKLVAAFSVQAIYTYYYTDRSTADIYRFFDDGLILRDIALESPLDFLRIMTGFYPEEAFREQYFDRMNAWIKPFETGFYNDNHTMIRINAVLSLISFGFYEVHGVVATLLSFTGMLLAARAVSRSHTALLILAFTVLPGLLLWTSGMLKESLVVLGIGLCIHVVFRPMTSIFKSAFILLLGMVIMLLVKPYFLAAFLPATIAWKVTTLLPVDWLRQKFIMQWGLWGLMLCLGFFLMHSMGINLLEEITQKQHDFLNHAHEIGAGSLIATERLEPSFLHFLLRSPEAIMQCLFMPFPWNISSLSSIPLLLENILLIILVIFILFRGSKAITSIGRSSFLIQWIIPLTLLIGYTTPVLGAVMRYRAPVLLILLLFLFQYLHDDRYRTL